MAGGSIAYMRNKPGSSDWLKTEEFMKNALGRKYMKVLEYYANAGVQFLSEATPVDTGYTASSWGYQIVQTANGFEINWNNTNVNKGVNIAVILEYGHGTRNGGYVRGRKYIKPAIQPIFDKLAEAAWKEVTGK